MNDTRLEAGFAGVTALWVGCLGCTSLSDLSAYSAGPSDAAATPSFEAPAAAMPASAAAPPPDAGSDEPSIVEAQSPGDVPLLPADSEGAEADCSGPGEFSAADSSSCYRLDETFTGWGDARTLCQSWGGDLAQLEAMEESTLLAEHADRDAWLGASDLDEEGTFRWVDGAEVDRDGAWAVAQPDNYGGRENCLELRAEDDLWNDVPCMGYKQALCERAMGAAR